MSDDSIKRGGTKALMPADEEQALRNLRMPIRCCDYWPECAHVLAWYEARADSNQEDAPAKERSDA